MTKNELKLQSKIIKLEEENKKLEEKHKKPKRKLPMSASHLTLYIILGVYLTTAIFGIIMSSILKKNFPEYTVQIIIALFSFVGVCGTGTIAFYTNKAKSENELSAKERTIDRRLDLIKDVFEMKKNKQLDNESVFLALAIITDRETTINSNGFNGITTVEDTNYLAQNPMSENVENINDGTMPQG